MFVFDALRQVDPIRQFADFWLQNMRRGGGAMRHLPLALPVEQRCLFLSACEGDAKFFALIDAQRSALEIAQDIGDFLIANRAPRYTARWSGVLTVRQKLKSAHAIAPDGGEQAIGVVAFRSDSFGQAPADLFIIRKQIVKDGDNRIADEAVFAQRERERHGE